MLAYRLMTALLRMVLRVFYRQVEVVGLDNVPAEGEGPVIFAGNHPNSLIDPVMIVATSGRIVHFAAKDVLFSSRFLRVFLQALGAVPIRRRVDHGGAGAVDNSAAFEALYGVLRGGRAIGIFPEGISHDRAQLARLKTGAARIALGVLGQQPDLPLKIVPCGLTYIHRRHFRSRVLVQYGEPIVIEPELLAQAGRTQEGQREAARQLTDRIDVGLRALTINAPDWDTLRTLDAVRRLYQPPKIPLAHRVELARRFAEVYPRVADQPSVMALRQRVQTFVEELSDLGLTDAQLRRPLSAMAVFLRVSAILFWTFILLPLAAPGVIVHAPIGILAGWGGHRFTPRKDVLATSKLLIGTMLVLLVYAVLGVLAARAFGPLGLLLTLVLLPVSGYATVRVLERTASLRRLVTRVVRSFAFRREVARLRALRGELEAEVVAAVQAFKPDEMVALYPRDSAPALAVHDTSDPAHA